MSKAILAKQFSPAKIPIQKSESGKIYILLASWLPKPVTEKNELEQPIRESLVCEKEPVDEDYGYGFCSSYLEPEEEVSTKGISLYHHKALKNRRIANLILDRNRTVQGTMTHPEITEPVTDLDALQALILSSPMASSTLIASGPVAVKWAIEDSGFLEEAFQPGSTLPNDLLRICSNNGIEPGPEQFVACVAFYVFGAVKLEESLDYVLSYTSRHEREIPTGWASHFATHALKILTDQEDRDDKYIFYDTTRRQDAINRALKYIYR